MDSRSRRLKSTYGITANQWDFIFNQQGSCCPICGKPIHRPGNPEGRRAAAVDHDHKTGRVRGLVCHVCNRQRIGMNTAETAKRLTAYLASKFDGRKVDV